jgi:Root hair defective 3 GTP-binding protein (RHD3)
MRPGYRFSEVLNVDERGTPRTWGASDNIMQIAQRARLAAANVLAQLAVVRRADGTDADSVSQVRGLNLLL